MSILIAVPLGSTRDLLSRVRRSRQVKEDRQRVLIIGWTLIDLASLF